MSALIRVQLSAQSARVRPGERADLTLTVQNFSEIVDHYHITVEGVPPSWVTVSQEEVALFPKDQDQVRITLHPPVGPESRADHYNVRIQATSRENAVERTTIDFDLEVVALPALELALRPQKQSGVSEGTFNLQVRNQGNADLTVHLEATDPEEGCLYTFKPSRLVLSPGQEQLVQLKAQPKVPLVGKQAKSYLFTVTARPAEDPGMARQVQGEWVQAPPTFELTLRPQRQSGVSAGTFTVQVSNLGHADLTVQLEATDPEEGCRYAFNPPRVVVPVAQERLAQLKVRPRAPLPGVTAKTFTVTVTARPTGAPRLAQQIQGEWEQIPPTFELSLPTQKQSGADEGIFTIQIRNLGSAELTVNLEATDPEKSCQYTFDPPQVAVPAGQERPAQLKIRPKAPLRGKEAKTYPFTVTARPAAAPRLTQQVQGEWEQLPRRRSTWLGLAAALLGIGCIVAVLAFVAVLVIPSIIPSSRLQLPPAVEAEPQPVRLMADEERVPANTPIILVAGWTADAPELVAEYLNCVDMVVILDGEPLPNPMDYWGEIEEAGDYNEDGDLDYVAHWRYPVGVLRPGAHWAEAEFSLRCPVTDGFDHDGDGNPDEFHEPYMLSVQIIVEE
jgi:uncharacterized membrane protein